MKRNRTTTLLGVLFALASTGIGSQLQATQIINETFRDGTQPAGWAAVDITFTTAAGGRADFIDIGSSLTSPVFDASAFDELSVVFQVAKFGTGDDGPVTVEYSLDGGDNWTVLGDSPTPTDANYLAADFVVPATSATMQLRFTRPNSPSAKRFRDLVVTGAVGSTPPDWGTLTVTDITLETAQLTVPFTANSGGGFIDHGFLVALSSVNAEPEFGDADADLVDFAGQPPATLQFVLTDLAAGTEYAVRAFARYDDGTVYSDTATFATRPPNPLLTDTPYTEDFTGFVDLPSLPAGWSFDLQGSSGAYIGDWGTGVSAGFRGNEAVLGYQITNASDSLIKILTLVNDTGETITDLTIQYTGRGARLDQLKGAEYTVTVAGEEAAALAYETFNGDGQSRQAVVTGLNIANGESFTIEWAAAQIAAPAGSSHQIGISNLSVTVGGTELPPTIGLFALTDNSLSETGFGVDAEVTSDGGAAVTQMGFIRTLTAVEPNPTLDTLDAVIDYDDFPGESFFFIDYFDLEPGTSYTVRAFASNSEGTTYSAPLVVTTLSPPPRIAG